MVRKSERESIKLAIRMEKIRLQELFIGFELLK